MTARATVDRLLTSRAAQLPDDCFLRFRERELTYAEVEAESTSIASGLAALGLEKGHLLGVLMGNYPEFALTWFGGARLGVPIAPVNTAFRGRGLAHALNLIETDTLVVDAALADPLEAVAGQLDHVRRLIVRGDFTSVASKFPAWEVLPFSALEAAGATTDRPHASEGDLLMLLFTSGTTGRSKACMLSHRFGMRQAELMIENYHLRRDDILYCPFPLFHLDAAILTVIPALVLGTTAAIGHRFSVSRFWDEVRAFGATVFDFMGATLTMLHKQAPQANDRENPARLAWGVPVPDFAEEFEERFDLQLVELYGSTDVGVPIYQPVDEDRRIGACGRVVPSYDVRVFDEEDREVAAGETGEIVVRPLEPHLTSEGYFRMPEETIYSRRNLWFHTGDLARRDDQGFFYFVGRRNETIRRRGENISAFEVEESIQAHPKVLEVAAFGVASELSEEEVMVAIVPIAGQAIDPAELIEFCRDQVAEHMVPRYIDIADQLPRTPTEKVEKYRLAERGVTASTWDREEQSQ